MKTHPFCTLAAAALLACSPEAFAGSAPKGPAAPAPEAESPPSIEASLVYDTFYIFRGEELFEQVVWGQIDTQFTR